VLTALASLSRWSSRSVGSTRSEEHTSELQSLTNLVCRLLLEKKKEKKKINTTSYTQVMQWTGMSNRHQHCVLRSRVHPSLMMMCLYVHTSSFFFFFFLMIRRPPRSPLFPSPTLFRSPSSAKPSSVTPRGRPAGRRSQTV